MLGGLDPAETRNYEEHLMNHEFERGHIKPCTMYHEVNVENWTMYR